MLIDDVADLLKEVSSEVILPRFQRLGEGDVFEKTPGDVVTVADRESDALITTALLKLRPGSRVVGEEACAADCTILQGLDNGSVWLVDPLDGTANFAAGRGPFSVMVALLNDGEPILSWMLAPISGEMCVAERGSGAVVNGTRLVTTEPDPADLRGAFLTKFMPEEVSKRVGASSIGLATLPGLLCAGAEYPAVAKGDRHFAVFWRTYPWDHAPGMLFLEEAGGAVRRPGGQRYSVASEENGLVLARTPATLDTVVGKIEF
ncbi:MAG: inositol monophosphatase family protein [Sphingomicrobium sp.]